MMAWDEAQSGMKGILLDIFGSFRPRHTRVAFLQSLEASKVTMEDSRI